MMEEKYMRSEDFEMLKEILGEVKAIPIDATTLMAAYQLGFLNGQENQDQEINPELYRKTCISLQIPPVETIDELIKELVTRQATLKRNELID